VSIFEVNMNQYVTEAILLAVRDWGNADRMVTLFSREYGKFSAAAYGARQPKSRLSGLIQPFVYADLAIIHGKNTDSIAQCEVRRSFRELRENLNYMAYGTFLAEVVIELWPEREPAANAFESILAAFSLLTVRNPRIVALACAWQLLSLAGFRPEYLHCVSCGCIPGYPVKFDLREGGIVCNSCKPAAQMELSHALADFLDMLLHLDFSDPPQFSVGHITLVQAEKLLYAYLVQCLERPLKSLDFIRLLSEPLSRNK